MPHNKSACNSVILSDNHCGGRTAVQNVYLLASVTHEPVFNTVLLCDSHGGDWRTVWREYLLARV